ncbi:MAG: hypothetical protein WEB04_11300 [Dehalococcoidia bacterium]
MPKRFYAAWAVAVLLAVVLPIAIPYAIWPQAYYDDADGSGDCASIAKDYAADGPTALWPASVRVEECSGGLADPGMRMLVHVQARGPYGIVVANATVTETDIRHFREDGSGMLFGMAALLAGVVAVSLPFALALVNVRLRLRQAAHA